MRYFHLFFFTMNESYLLCWNVFFLKITENSSVDRHFLGYCEWWCSKCESADVSSKDLFHFPLDMIAGSAGGSIFSFWRNLLTVFHHGYTNLHPHQQCKGSLFSTSMPGLTVFVLLIIEFVTRMRWCLILVLICVPCWLVILNIISCTCWSLAFLSLRNVFKSTAIFKLSCLFC